MTHISIKLYKFREDIFGYFADVESKKSYKPIEAQFKYQYLKLCTILSITLHFNA